MATAWEVMETAAKEIGTTDGGNNCVKYWADIKPSFNCVGNWCVGFIQWCLWKHGMWYSTANPGWDYLVSAVRAKAKADGTYRSKSWTPRLGDFVIYGDTSTKHIGLIEKVYSNGDIGTIEGNTSSGAGGSQTNGEGVYRRRRSRSWVMGFVDNSDFYDKAPNLGGGMSAPISAPKPKPSGKLEVDGYMGPNTIRKWQRVMGTEADGVISRPSDLVRAVQRELNRKGARLTVDGKGIGSNNSGRYPSTGYTNTLKALQRHLGTHPDGYLSSPSDAVRALQRRLNEGKF